MSHPALGRHRFADCIALRSWNMHDSVSVFNKAFAVTKSGVSAGEDEAAGTGAAGGGFQAAHSDGAGASNREAEGQGDPWGRQHRTEGGESDGPDHQENAAQGEQARRWACHPALVA